MSILKGNKMSAKQRKEQQYNEALKDRQGFLMAENIHMPEQWVWTRYLTNGLIAFFGSFGLISCFLGSFGFTYHAPLLAVCLLLVSLYIATIYYKYKNLGYILFILVYLQLILKFRVLANSGFANILNVLRTYLSREIGLPTASQYVENSSDTTMAVTVCAIFVGCLFVVLLSITVQEYMSMWDILAVTVPLAQFGMLFGRQPSMWSVIILLCCWVMVEILRSGKHYRQRKPSVGAFGRKRKKTQHSYIYISDSKVNTQILLSMGSFFLVVVLVLSLLTPDGLKSLAAETNNYREQLITQVRYLMENGFEQFMEQQGAGGVNGGRLGEVGTVRQDNQTDIVVKMAPYSTERKYLRSYTGSVYTGRSFDTINNNIWQMWRECGYSVSAGQLQEASYNTLWYRKQIENASSDKDSAYYQGKMEITNVDANASYMYLPYFSQALSITPSEDVQERYTSENAGGLFDAKMQATDYLSCVQDDVVYGKLQKQDGYTVNFMDTDLSVEQIDKILQKQRSENRGRIDWDGGELLYLERLSELELEKKGKSPGRETLAHRYLMLSVDNIMLALLLLDEKETGIPRETWTDLIVNKGLQYDEPCSEFYFNQVWWQRASLDRNSNRFEKMDADSRRLYYIDEDKMSFYPLEKEKYWNILNEKPFRTSNDGFYGVKLFCGYGSIPAQLLGDEEAVLDLYMVTGDSQDVFEGENIRNGNHPVSEKGILGVKSVSEIELGDGRISQVMSSNTAESGYTGYCLSGGTKVNITDSIEDHIYRGYVYENYLSDTVFCEEALAQFCEKYDIHPEDENVVEEVVDALDDAYTYVLNPGVTPSDEDYVTYFMTQQKKGFCVHFAATATMLFRYLGIPARYAEGYVIDYVDEISSDIVSEDTEGWIDHVDSSLAGDKGTTAVVEVEVPDTNAHAWTEIYLDDYGWVAVDATPAAGIESDFDSFWEDYGRDTDEEGGNALLQNIGSQLYSVVSGKMMGIFLFIILPCAVLAVILVRILYRKRKRYLSWHTKSLKDNLKGLYRVMVDRLSCVGLGQKNGLSYTEYGRLLVQQGFVQEEEAVFLMEVVEEAFYGREINDEKGEMVMSLMQQIMEKAGEGQKPAKRFLLWLH